MGNTLFSARIGLFGIGIAFFGIALISSFLAKGDSPSFSFLNGRFLIEAESKGQAWYVMPESGKRVFFGEPEKAFVHMREIATPVSFETIEKIPNAIFFKNISMAQTQQSKADSPYAGRILLQADRAPYDAWYVSPQNGLRYSLRTPYELFRVIQNQALGISEANIKKIPTLALSDDKHALKREPAGTKETIISPHTQRADTPDNTVKFAEALIEGYRKNNNASEQLALVSVNGDLMMLYPEFNQWYAIDGKVDANSFQVIYTSSSQGRYINYVAKRNGTDAPEPLKLSEESNAYLYGLYVFNDKKDKDDSGATFVIRDEKGIATFNLKILLSEKRYAGIDSQSFVKLNSGNPLLNGADVYKDKTSLYLLLDGELQRVIGTDSATVNTWGTADGRSVIADQYGMFALDASGEPYRVEAEYPDTLAFDGQEPYYAALAYNSFLSDPRTGRVRKTGMNKLFGYSELYPGIYSKNGSVYTLPKFASEPVLLEGADAASFTVWPESDERFFTDMSRVYFYNGETIAGLPSIDTATFSELAKSGDWHIVKDKDGVYAIPKEGIYDQETGARAFKTLRQVDAYSLQILYSDGNIVVAKDKNSVYAGSDFTPVAGADAASFHIVLTVEGIPFGRDQYNIFYALPKNPGRLYRLAGADPRTFQMKTVPIIEPAMNALTYQGSGRLAYAHDDKWIWFYDAQAGGIAVIKRARSEERVAPEDILEFARMYSHFF